MVDLNAAILHLSQAFRCLGADMESEHFKGTPKRVASMYKEIFSDKDNIEYTLFDNSDKQSQMVIVKDIPFTSWCSHHLLPFVGKAHVGYIPSKHIVGLSKIARCVIKNANSPQVQEKLVKDIGDELNKVLKPKGLVVLLEAEHHCMSCRGIHVVGSVTQTCKLWGDIDKFEFFESLKLKTI